MVRDIYYETAMEHSESNALFSDGEHPWNEFYRTENLVLPERTILNKGLRSVFEREGWSEGMPVPLSVITNAHRSGVEKRMIAVTGSDGNVYSGTATRYFDPKRFKAENHKVALNFILGDEQSDEPITERLSQYGFKKRNNVVKKSA